MIPHRGTTRSLVCPTVLVPVGRAGYLGPRERGSVVRVRVSFTVEVDQKAWADAYGMDNDAGDIRADVNAWAYHGILSHIEQNGLGPVQS